MKEVTKWGIPVISLIVTLATILWATSGDRANAWAAINANAIAIKHIEDSMGDLKEMGKDVAVIKEIIKRFDAENQRRHNQ